MSAFNGDVRQWDTATGQPVGRVMAQPHRVASLQHRAMVLAVAFTPDSRSVLTVTESGRTHTWPLPTPVVDDRERITCWLQVTSGMERQGNDVILQDSATWRQREEELRRRWPDPDPALALTLDDASWHELRARDSEEDHNTRAALRHLDHLLALHPGEWSLYARQGRLYTREGALDLAAAADDQAAAQGGGAALLDWYRQRVQTCTRLGQQDLAQWYQQRLRAAGAAD